MVKSNRPDERINLVIERRAGRITVKAYYYRGETLVAVATPWRGEIARYDESDPLSYGPQDLAELLSLRDEVIRGVRLWSSQLTLPLA